MEQYMDTYLSFCRLEAYAPILVLVIIALNVIFHLWLAHAAHVRNNQMQDMRELERRIKRERTALRKEREASRKEREAWNTDYRVYCARFEGRNRH